MSQISKVASAQVKARSSDEAYGRAITATLALAATVIVAALLLTRPPIAIPAGAGGANELTDGFLPGAIAAQQMRSAQALSDGWEVRLVGPGRDAPNSVRDGWEGSLVPPVTLAGELTDGWESALLK
jgi:hypothetical protein